MMIYFNYFALLGVYSVSFFVVYMSHHVHSHKMSGEHNFDVEVMKWFNEYFDILKWLLLLDMYANHPFGCYLHRVFKWLVGKSVLD